MAFKNFPDDAWEKRLKPVLLAQEWADALGVPGQKISIIDINHVSISLALGVISTGKILLTKNELRLAREENRISGMWADNYQKSQLLDDYYKAAMKEQLAELSDELELIKNSILADGYANPITYRAAERNLQLLIEACIGIAKQALKSQKVNVPNEAREAFSKLKSLGLDNSDIPWSKVVGMRNALVHDYLNLDKERIIAVITQNYYAGLLDFANRLIE